MDLFVGDEADEHRNKGDQALDQELVITDRFTLVQCHDIGDPLRLDGESIGEHPGQQRHQGAEDNQHHWAHVGQEFDEAQVGSGTDDDAGRVTDQGRGTTDVGCERFDDQKWHGADR